MQQIDLVLNKGTDFACMFICVDGMGKAVDFTGYSAKMQVKNNAYGRVLDELSTDNGRLQFDIERGSILARFPNEITAGYPAAKLLYDIVMENESGYVFRAIEGSLKVRQGVTI